MIALIWAQARGGVIGRAGAIPWHLPEEQAHFRARTTGAVVVMGRRTWDSLPDRFRPLPGRRNIVLTRQPGWGAPGAEVAPSLDAAISLAGGTDVWVIGGAGVYAEALGRADRIERTEVDLDVDGDVRAPELGAGWALQGCEPGTGWTTSRTGTRFRVCSFVRAPVRSQV